MTVYERWYHEKLGVRAVRIQQGRITGVCALPLEEAARAALDTLEYDARPEAIRGIWAASEQFFLFEPWRRGERISPSTRPRARAAAPRPRSDRGLLSRALQRVATHRRVGETLPR
jgi:hypothetical protein